MTNDCCPICAKPFEVESFIVGNQHIQGTRFVLWEQTRLHNRCIVVLNEKFKEALNLLIYLREFHLNVFETFSSRGYQFILNKRDIFSSEEMPSKILTLFQETVAQKCRPSRKLEAFQILQRIPIDSFPSLNKESLATI